jgi:hypothetical protein
MYDSLKTDIQALCLSMETDHKNVRAKALQRELNFLKT